MATQTATSALLSRSFSTGKKDEDISQMWLTKSGVFEAVVLELALRQKFDGKGKTVSETLFASIRTSDGQCDDYANITYTHKTTGVLVESGNVNGDKPDSGMIAKMCARLHTILGDDVEFKVNFASHIIVTNKAGEQSKSFDFIYKKKNGKWSKLGGLPVGIKVQFKANPNGGLPEKDIHLLTIGSKLWDKAKEDEPNMPQILGQAPLAANAAPKPQAADVAAMFSSATSTPDVIEDDVIEDDVIEDDVIEDDVIEDNDEFDDDIPF